MKHSIKTLIGSTMGATDGDIGKIKEFYFDDETWTIRYLIVDTGNWLAGRKVLISPNTLLTPDWEKKVFPINLTKEQIKNSPDIDTDKPVSRQQEILLYEHYAKENSWSGGFYAGGLGLPIRQTVMKGDDSVATDEIEGDLHLRSTNAVTGYHIKANNGEIGDVEDFIIEDNNWKIDFMVVDTGHWFPGKKVLISPKWIKEIKWDKSLIIVSTDVEHVKNSPEYQPGEYLLEEYAESLHHYYANKVL